MTKINSNVPKVGEIGYGNGYVVCATTPDRLVGKIFPIIEIANLTEKQENNIKDLIKGVIWNIFREGIYISPERHTEIRKLYKEKSKNNESCSIYGIEI
jgi:hypothetical protein